MYQHDTKLLVLISVLLCKNIVVLHKVDKHIRKLDADLARFEADLKDKSSAAKLKSDSDSGKKSEWNSQDRFLHEENWFTSCG